MIERRPMRRRSNPRDNRWRRTLPEANILIRKLLGLSTSSHWSYVIGRLSLVIAMRAIWQVTIGY
jgi:hypothetical protein